MDILEKWGATLKQNTKKSYYNKLLDILVNTKMISKQPNDYTDDDCKTVIEYIDKKDDTQSTKKQAVSGVMSYFKYHNIHNTILSDYIQKHYHSNNELKSDIPDYEELYELWENIDEDTYLEDKVILDLYLNYPALRSDLFLVKIRAYDENDKYYKDGYIHIGNCIKTNKQIEDIKLNDKS